MTDNQNDYSDSPINPEFMCEIETALMTSLDYAINQKNLSPAMQKIRIADLKRAEEVLDKISAWFEN